MGDLQNFLQVTAMKAMSTFQRCTFNEYMMVADQRLSSIPFASGLAAKIVVQLAQYPSSPLYVAGNTLSTAFTNKDWTSVGKGTQLLLAKLLDFVAPRIKDTPTTY